MDGGGRLELKKTEGYQFEEAKRRQKVPANERGSGKTTERWSKEQSVSMLPPCLQGGAWRSTMTAKMEGKPTQQQHEKQSPNPDNSPKDIAKGWGPLGTLNPHLLDIPLGQGQGNEMTGPAPQEPISGVHLPATPPPVARATPTFLGYPQGRELQSPTPGKISPSTKGNP